MTAFVVIGIAGLVLVVASLVLGEVFEGLFDAIDIDAGSGLFSAPVIGAFLAAFGFGAALTMSATAVGTGVAALAGVGAGVGFGAATLALTRSLMNMRTDDNVRTGDLVGRPGTVLTRIPPDGFGEVAVVHLGQRLKLNARAASPIPAGTPVVVTDVVSASSVHVEPEVRFWADETTGGN